MKLLLFSPALLCLSAFDKTPVFPDGSIPVAHVIVAGEELEQVLAAPVRDVHRDIHLVVQREKAPPRDAPEAQKIVPEKAPPRDAAEAKKVVPEQAGPDAAAQPNDKGPGAGNAQGEQLGALKNHLNALGKKLEDTEKTVEEIRRLRDAAMKNAEAAKAEADRHLQNHLRAMQQLQGLQKDLAAARKESAGWKEKAEAGAMTHEELLNFRGDLTGARRQMELLKRDFAEARSELQDPIERAALKKSLEKSDGERKTLGSEIEVALNAKKKTEEEARRMRTELESKLEVMRGKIAEAGKLKAVLAERTASWEAGQARAQELAAEVARLESDRAALQDDLAVAKGSLQKMQSGLEAKEVEASRRVEAAMVAGRKAAAERDRLVKELDGVRKQIEKAGSETAALRKSLATAEEQLKAADEARKTAARETEESREALDRTREEMAFVTKAKEGLEELLFQKTAELRELRVEVRKLKSDGKKEDGKGNAHVDDDDLGLLNAPRAIIVAEG